MGNEAGDLDSYVALLSSSNLEIFLRRAETCAFYTAFRLVSALALAYAFTHSDPPVKAIALLQTEQGEFEVNFRICFGKLMMS